MGNTGLFPRRPPQTVPLRLSIYSASIYNDLPELNAPSSRPAPRVPFREDLFAEDYSAMEPVKNPMRHVGRNDPCPCGSGKRAKKCWHARTKVNCGTYSSSIAGNVEAAARPVSCFREGK
jgi:hypothetical protein